MRIGALSKTTGLSHDTIRFYEREGLIASQPSGNPTNNYRDYPEVLVERLEMIIEARESGMSVADLKLLLECMEGPPDGSFNADSFLAGKIAEVELTITRAQRLLSNLKATAAAIAMPEKK